MSTSVDIIHMKKKTGDIQNSVCSTHLSTPDGHVHSPPKVSVDISLTDIESGQLVYVRKYHLNILTDTI